MKSIEERGSPCLKPVMCLNGLPGIPFRRTLEVEEAKRMEMRLHHLCLKPNAFITFSKYGHPTVSKAFAMSSLRKMRRCFFFMCLLYDIVDIEKVILDASFLNKGALARGNKVFQKWSKSVRQDLA
jgi:hypothetical protein